MLQLRNTSPFVPALFSAPNCHGIETLVVVVKGTFTFGSDLEIAADQAPVVLADEYWGDPSSSSLRCAGELHLPKPGTDVIVIGEACAPRDQAVTELDVVVRVRDRTKHARVYGDRFWTQGVRGTQPSAPRPFQRMPLTYERAYGGRHVTDAQSSAYLAEPRNPVGVGFVGRRQPDDMLGQPVPNLDDPSQPLAWLGQTPAPIGFGAVAPMWQPRVGFVGTYDQHWRKTRAPFLPGDFDSRYFQVGAPGLVFDQPLQGGELIGLRGFHADRIWQFALPRCELDVVARFAGARHRLQPVLDTVLLEPNEARCSLVWRSTLVVDEDPLRVEGVDISLARMAAATGFSVQPTRGRP